MKQISERLVKRVLLCISIVLLSMVSFASTYYVSSVGNDTNSGLSTTTPWKSLTKVNSVIFKPGDAILFRRGDTFYGTLLINASGTASAAILYSAYGTGSMPIISGFQKITNWKYLEKGRYYAPTTAPNTIKMVAVNGTNTPKGRFPNTGYLSFESHILKTSITDNQLISSPNWTGAEVFVKIYPFRSQVTTITNHVASSLTFSAISSEPGNGNGYFIQNSLDALDLVGDWCIKNGVFSMCFGAFNPNDYAVNASILDRIIYSSGKSYITVDGLSMQGANYNEVDIVGGSNFSIKNCEISLAGKTGICSSGTLTKVTGCNIHDTNGIAVYSAGGSILISNNVIKNVALLEGMSTLYFYYGIYVNSNNSTIEYNTISNLGSGGIWFRGNNILVKNNFIDRFGLNLTDCGGIYTDTALPTGRVIQDNIVTNGLCSLSGTTIKEKATVGIYLDECSENITVEGNTVANIDGFGILLHGSRNNIVKNNTVFNCSLCQFILSHNTSAPNQSNISLTGNSFVAKEASQYTFRFYSIYNDINFGSASSNVYARPIDDNLTFKIDTYNTAATNYNLAGWKTLSNYDANSTKSPFAITNSSDVAIEYNASKTVKTVTLAYPVINLLGIKYSGIITLQPYKSIVLLRDPNPLLKSATITPILTEENISIPEGSNYNGWLTSGVYERILLSGSGRDSIVKTYLSVIPQIVDTESKINTNVENSNALEVKEIMDFDLYPNPSQGNVTIRFSELPEAGSRIDILDVSGRSVDSRLISNTTEEFNLNMQSSGLYFVKSIIGANKIIKKLIINK